MLRSFTTLSETSLVFLECNIKSSVVYHQDSDYRKVLKFLKGRGFALITLTTFRGIVQTWFFQRELTNTILEFASLVRIPLVFNAKTVSAFHIKLTKRYLNSLLS